MRAAAAILLITFMPLAVPATAHALLPHSVKKDLRLLCKAAREVISRNLPDKSTRVYQLSMLVSGKEKGWEKLANPKVLRAMRTISVSGISPYEPILHVARESGLERWSCPELKSILDGTPTPQQPLHDPRVQTIVRSYPSTTIETGHPALDYPAALAAKGGLPKGWQRVYLLLSVDDGGSIEKVSINGPGKEKKEDLTPLVGWVEQKVRQWQFDKVPAEVHVDTRFYIE